MQSRELRDLLTSRDREIFSATLNAITEHFERWPRQARANIKLFDDNFRPGYESCLFRDYRECAEVLRIIGYLKALGLAPDQIRLVCYAKRCGRDLDDGSKIVATWVKRLNTGWRKLFDEDLEPGRIVVHRRTNPKSDAARRYLAVVPVFPSGKLIRAAKGFSGAVRFAARWLAVVDKRKQQSHNGESTTPQEERL